MSNTHPFETLTPSFIMDAVESLGYLCDGRNLALNSYENRVYQVGIEDQQPLIVKFYRPERWSREQILEEHSYSYELAEHELPVVAPTRNDNGDSLFEYGPFMMSVFERKGGRGPELDDLDNLFTMGRLLGRMHLIGASKPYQHRPSINPQTFGHDSVELISNHFIPAELKPAYDSLTADLLPLIDKAFANAGDITPIRVHGDCHGGNLLWRDDAPHFVDFDDSRMAPAIQDIWMLLSGDTDRQRRQLSEIVDGYNEFYDFHPRELALIEPLRTLRMMYYSAWLARRWEDPAFPHSFPWFNTVRYWSDHILELREQLAALQAPAIELF
ncbi:serine/threonine protein kinase [Aliamphritea spongicola]|uniref:serine/threonine protein kinase n=1 Tax=Aliamphritea spongicola TaxID=707589 RepID=UPI00196BA26C|nr:serine/threonine protein kinase [Aliamphritea spongicola]MBN3564790.1 serine/threonine protein kinase [Aliamphritea spongicola]